MTNNKSQTTKEERIVKQSLGQIPVDQNFKRELGTVLEQRAKEINSDHSLGSKLRAWFYGLITYGAVATLALTFFVVNWVDNNFGQASQNVADSGEEDADTSGQAWMPAASNESYDEDASATESIQKDQQPSMPAAMADVSEENESNGVLYREISGDQLLYWGNVEDEVDEIGFISSEKDYENRKILNTWSNESDDRSTIKLLFIDVSHGFAYFERKVWENSTLSETDYYFFDLNNGEFTELED